MVDPPSVLQGVALSDVSKEVYIFVFGEADAPPTAFFFYPMDCQYSAYVLKTAFHECFLRVDKMKYFLLYPFGELDLSSCWTLTSIYL